MFLFVFLISGCADTSSEEDSSNYVLQVHKVTSGEVVHNFINDSWFLCHVATWTSHVTTSKSHASVTSRRVFLRRDVKISCFCHVATCIFTSRRQIYMSLSCRDVDSNVATSISQTLCHVATCIFTSRREIVPASVTSRRGLQRRDVA